MKNLFVIIGLSFLVLSCSKNVQKWQLQSPDNNICISLELKEDGSLTYSVQLEDTTIVKSSSIGIIRSDMSFDKELKFIAASNVVNIDEKYEMHIGKRKLNRNFCNEQVYSFKNKQGSQMDIAFRAYNDGIAFRYVFPEKTDTAVYFMNELSSFHIPVNGKAWMQPYDTMSHWSLSYERLYHSEIPIGTNSPESYGWCFPLLFELNNGIWMFVSEADLDENYCAMHIQHDANDGNYRISFPEAYEAYGNFSRYPKAAMPGKTPWRFIIISDQLSEVVTSNRVYDLSASNQLGDMSWVKPGKASWSWWSDANSSFNFIPLKEHIDLAVTMGWPYSLVDADWDIMINGDIKKLSEYAKEKNIDLMLWYNSGGLNNRVQWRFVILPDSIPSLRKKGVSEDAIKLLKPIIGKEFFPEDKFLNDLKDLLGEELYTKNIKSIDDVSRFRNAWPRDKLHTQEARDKEFPMLEEMGVKGLKIDFFMTDKQEIIKTYLGIIKDAAKHKMLVNTHGCTLPRGWSRTYPNLVSMESVMGAEMYASPSWPKDALSQNNLYPYIRNVVGPMDYTPVTFSSKRTDSPRLTSYAHELALTIIFDNGILHIAEGAYFLLNKSPKSAVEFLKKVPVTWDETHFIEGYPGRYTVMLREKDGVYYLAGINGEMKDKEILLTKSFLPEGNYSMEFYCDGNHSNSMNYKQDIYHSTNPWFAKMISGGGFVCVFKKQ